MKKLIFFSVLICFVSCTKNPFKETVLNSIKKDAMGIDLKPKFITFEVLDTVYNKELVDDWYLMNSDMSPKKDSIKIKLAEFAKNCKFLTNHFEYTGHDSKYYADYVIIANYKLDRIKQLETRKSTNIEYYVIKTEYKIINPIINNAEVTVSEIILISDKLEVIIKKNADDFAKVAEKCKQTPYLKYEALILSEKTGLQL